MKRVCTLRKVLHSFFKGPLRKVILLFLYIVWFFMTTQFLLFLNVVAFCRHSVLVVYEYLQPGDFSCCKYKYNFRNLQVFEHFFSKKGYFSYVFYKIAPILGF